LVIDDVRMRRGRPFEVGDVDPDVLGSHDGTTASAVTAHLVVHEFAMLSDAHRSILSAVLLARQFGAGRNRRPRVPVGTVTSRAHSGMRALRSGVDAGRDRHPYRVEPGRRDRLRALFYQCGPEP
jgi:hypothetical protein